MPIEPANARHSPSSPHRRQPRNPAHVEAFEYVCRILHHAGFDIAHNNPGGLQIGLRNNGIRVGWRTAHPTHLPPGTDTTPWEPDLLIRCALNDALAAILRQSDLIVTDHDGDLLILFRPSGRAAGDGTG